jgi:rhodanese-related sulfurtransferase
MSGTFESLPIEIDVRDVKSLLDAEEDFLLLDCREQDEYELVRIGGATLLPMSEIQARFSELEPHRERRIVVHCHHGGRSMQVAQWLRGQGFIGVQNMRGGIDQWAVEIEPTLPRY